MQIQIRQQKKEGLGNFYQAIVLVNFQEIQQSQKMNNCLSFKHSVQQRFNLRQGVQRNYRIKWLTKCQILQEGDKVAVAGATGGTGQLIVKRLSEKGLKVKTLVRKIESAQELFSGLDNVEICQMDLRNESRENIQSELKGVDAVCCCVGTTAFPSQRWNGGNGPRPTDYVSVKNLISGTPRDIKRFAFVSSAGVTRESEFPYFILNWFGVLKYKRAAEMELIQSGLEYTIVRPSRLIGAPYTNYDVNSQLQPSGDEFTGVQLSAQDDIEGPMQCARKHLVESVVQSFFIEEMTNKSIAICSLEGEVGPEDNPQKWKELFQRVLV
eukprot:TRINITY_DN23010_c0_g1_i1.p1 TRINITY_DN23010_c0_g1~~TRINITY_DN23010_c0_g1_i1.p1  ORF type:complete len:325 (-),score=38.85 TRINITY_DN23010_c0_g1_i1:152-1126(-)